MTQIDFEVIEAFYLSDTRDDTFRRALQLAFQMGLSRAPPSPGDAAGLREALNNSLRFAGHLGGCDWAVRACDGKPGCKCGYLTWRDSRAAALSAAPPQTEDASAIRAAALEEAAQLVKEGPALKGVVMSARSATRLAALVRALASPAPVEPARTLCDCSNPYPPPHACYDVAPASPSPVTRSETCVPMPTARERDAALAPAPESP